MNICNSYGLMKLGSHFDHLKVPNYELPIVVKVRIFAMILLCNVITYLSH
jgi:hypothetical protein